MHLFLQIRKKNSSYKHTKQSTKIKVCSYSKKIIDINNLEVTLNSITYYCDLIQKIIGDLIPHEKKVSS